MKTKVLARSRDRRKRVEMRFTHLKTPPQLRTHEASWVAVAWLRTVTKGFRIAPPRDTWPRRNSEPEQRSLFQPGRDKPARFEELLGNPGNPTLSCATHWIVEKAHAKIPMVQTHRFGRRIPATRLAARFAPALLGGLNQTVHPAVHRWAAP